MQLEPKLLDAKILRGMVAIFQKDYATAERYFELAHLQSPRTFLASNDLALALIEQNDQAKKLRAWSTPRITSDNTRDSGGRGGRLDLRLGAL